MGRGARSYEKTATGTLILQNARSIASQNDGTLYLAQMVGTEANHSYIEQKRTILLEALDDQTVTLRLVYKPNQ